MNSLHVAVQNFLDGLGDVRSPESQKKLRIHVSLWAYAYEVEGYIIVPDADYDRISKMIDVSIDTDNPNLDQWFRKNFNHDTGSWIYDHPHFDRFAQIYKNVISGLKNKPKEEVEEEFPIDDPQEEVFEI